MKTIRNRYFFIFLTLLSLLTSCNSDEKLSYESLTKKVNQYSFKITPLNPEKLFTINYKSSGNFSRLQKDSIINDYSKYLCFVLEIKIDGFENDITQYSEPGSDDNVEKKNSYYLFNMQNDINIIDEVGNKMPCQIYFYERANDLTKRNRFIVGFNKPGNQHLHFELENKYFTCGKIKIKLDKQPLALN